MLFTKSRALIAVGVTQEKLADVLKPEERNINEILKIILEARTLPTMLGKTIIQLILMALP